MIEGRSCFPVPFDPGVDPEVPVTAAASPELVEVGRIAKPHGLKGALIVQTLTPGSDLLLDVETLVLEIAGKRVEMKVRDASGEGSGVRLFLSGVPDRTAAEKVVGAKVFVRRDQFPEDDDGVWIDALIGWPVVSKSGESLGKVVEFESSPMQEWLVVEGAAGRTLVPFTEPLCVVEDDRVVVDAPPGLFDFAEAVDVEHGDRG